VGYNFVVDIRGLSSFV